MEENNVIISLQHVSKVFDKTFTAVDDVSLDIKKGKKAFHQIKLS